MEKALIIQNRHWNNERYTRLIDRDLLDSIASKLRIKEIQVLLGVRRSGKSTIFKLLINRLLEKTVPQSVLYMNLDDPFFSGVWKDARELYSVVETAEKITKQKVKYLLLDEVQNVQGWEKYVKSSYDSEVFKKIFITGSNSSLLKGGYARMLSGRYVTDFVYPLSFREILKSRNLHSLKDILNNKSVVLNILDDVLFFGAFPEVYKTEDRDMKREILLNYYETIILKDCIANHNVRDSRTFRELSNYLISNVSALYSYHSIAHAVGSNENTVRDFINILEDSFLISETRNFSWSLKSQARSKKKSYCIDNSFMNTVSFKFSENKGKLLENLVYTEFLKNGYREIFFYNETRECDFILKKEKELTAVQVSYEINDTNIGREIEGLRAAMKKFAVPKGYIVTYNQGKQIDKDILIIPFWKMHEEIFG
jgi:predicted AAA+ superfamily ATPase